MGLRVGVWMKSKQRSMERSKSNGMMLTLQVIEGWINDE